MRAALNLGLTDLTYLGALSGLELGGRIEGQAAIDTMGEAAFARADLEASEVQTPWAEAKRAAIDANVRDPLGALELDAQASLEEIAVPRVTISAAEVQARGGMELLTLGLTAQGAIDGREPLELALEGQAQPAVPALRITVLSGKIGEYPIQLQDTLEASMAGGDISVSPFRLDLAGGYVDGGGELTAERVSLRLAWDALPLDMTEVFDAPPVEGTLSGEVAVNGRPDAPQIEAIASLSEFRMEPMGTGARGFADVRARIGDGRATAELQARLPDAATVDGNAAVPVGFSLQPFAYTLEPDAAISGALQLQADLEKVLAAIPFEDHYAEGQLNGDLQFSGRIDRPLVNGAVTLEEGRYENLATGTILERMQVNLLAEGQSGRLEQFEAYGPEDGRISADGSIDFSDLTLLPMSLSAQLERAQLVNRDDMTGVLDGTASIEGDLARLDVVGDLTVGPFTYQVPTQIPPRTLRSLEVEEAGAADAEAEAGEDAEIDADPPTVVGLDIRVALPGRVYVRGPALETEWEGNLDVSGSADDPRLDGVLRIRQGTLDFLGRRFVLDESSIAFDGSQPPSPYLDMLAEAQTRDVLARMRLFGTMDTLEIELSSEPSLPQDEILARILFDRELDEITPIQALQVARAAAMLSGSVGGSRLFAGDLSLPGLDRFNLQMGDAPGETSVTLGKYLTEKIYVEVEQGVGKDSTNLDAEIQLNPIWSIEAQTGATGESSLGILYKRDY